MTTAQPRDDTPTLLRALDHHRVGGELPAGVPARLAVALGCPLAKVVHALRGHRVELDRTARAKLDAYLADPKPLPEAPGDKWREGRGPRKRTMTNLTLSPRAQVALLRLAELPAVEHLSYASGAMRRRSAAAEWAILRVAEEEGVAVPETDEEAQLELEKKESRKS